MSASERRLHGLPLAPAGQFCQSGEDGPVADQCSGLQYAGNGVRNVERSDIQRGSIELIEESGSDLCGQPASDPLTRGRFFKNSHGSGFLDRSPDCSGKSTVLRSINSADTPLEASSSRNAMRR